MKHDVSHEKRQNAALRLLASSLAGLAAEMGKSGHKGLPAALDELLGPGEEADAPAEVEEEK